MKKLLKYITKSIVKTLAPNYSCYLCGREVYDLESHLCEDCKKKFPYITGTYCEFCGAPNLLQVTECNYCRDYNFCFDGARSYFLYNRISNPLIHKLKFGGKAYISKLLGKMVYDVYVKWGIKADVVIPAPLSPKSFKTREYNQAELIAKVFSSYSKLPVETKAIYKIKDTKKQAKLSKEDRLTNLDKAFKRNAKVKIKDKVVLLIDDVFTTGTTVNEISKELLKGKPKAIYVITPAKTCF